MRDDRVPFVFHPELTQLASNGAEVIRIVVSPSGKPVTCSVSVIGHGRVQDPQNCKHAMYLTGSAATDANGAKIYGVKDYILMWRRTPTKSVPAVTQKLEPDFKLPLSRLPEGISDDSVSRLTVVTGTDGKIETCDIGKSSGSTALDAAACHSVSGAALPAVQNEQGVAVRAVQSVSVGFSK